MFDMNQNIVFKLRFSWNTRYYMIQVNLDFARQKQHVVKL